MDYICKIISDIKSSDQQYRNLNSEIKYNIQKAYFLSKKINTDDQHIAFMVENLNRKIIIAEGIEKRLDELFNAESIALKDKIRLSLPFNQIKSQATSAIQGLEKAITDLKEAAQQEEKVENKAGPVKRKISSADNGENGNERESPDIQEVDEQIQEIYEMGPTINDDELIFSQSKNKENGVQFHIEVKGNQQIVKMLQKQFPELHRTSKTINSHEKIEETPLYSVARINFQKCYNKLKQLTKDIDRISTKAHFHFVLKKIQKKPSENLPEPPNEMVKAHSTSKKKEKSSLEVPNKEEEEMFFSFPQENHVSPFENFQILMRKEDNKKIVYRLDMGQWIKVEEEEIELTNGEKLAAFVNPETKEPTIYFQLSYGLSSGC